MAPVSRHGHVVEVLGRRIASYELPSGAVVNLASIEVEFGVSRTVAREAMRLLESLGMLRARRRVGLIVTPEAQWVVLDPRVIGWRLAGPGYDDQLRSLVELRTAVEPIAARLAARNATPEQRQKLAELAATMRSLGEDDRGASPEYLEADVEFHRTLLRASGNQLFAALDQVVEAVLVGRTQLGFTPARPREEAMHLHDGTAQAVAAGDPRAAEERSRAMVAVVLDEVEGRDAARVSAASEESAGAAAG